MRVQSTHGSQVRFVGVPGLSDVSSMSDFVARHGAGGFAHLVDEGAVWRQFGVTQQRTYVLINDDGTWRRTGYGGLEAQVQELINS